MTVTENQQNQNSLIPKVPSVVLNKMPFLMAHTKKPTLFFKCRWTLRSCNFFLSAVPTKLSSSESVRLLGVGNFKNPPTRNAQLYRGPDAKGHEQDGEHSLSECYRSKGSRQVLLD